MGVSALPLDGFKDDVHDKTEAAEWAGGLTDAAFETGSGVAKRGFHLLDVYGVPLRDPGEVGDVAVAFGQQVISRPSEAASNVSLNERSRSGRASMTRLTRKARQVKEVSFMVG